MKTRIKWMIAFVAVAVSVIWLLGDRVSAGGQETPPEGDRVADLEKQVQTLRELVARLEERLAAVEQQNHLRLTEYVKDAAGVYQQPLSEPRAPWMQKYRPQGEINGIPYYVIPLKDRPGRTQHAHEAPDAPRP
jgi:hypothetical protein